jgi:hypothetical protein
MVMGGVSLAAAAMVLAFACAPAMADNLTVSLSNGVTTVTCADNAACDGASLLGVVSFSTAFGPVSVTGTGSGFPLLLGANMDLTYTLVSPGGAATYTIAVSENDLKGTSVSWNALDNGNQTASGVSTAFSSWASSTNTLFAQTTPLCGAGPASGAIVNLACGSGTFTSANFSLTEQITLVAGAGAEIASGDASLTATPEPASLVLFGSGLLGIAGIARRYLGIKA